jgi:hypothetical protein
MTVSAGQTTGFYPMTSQISTGGMGEVALERSGSPQAKSGALREISC